MPWSGSPPSQSFTRTDGTFTGDDVFAQEQANAVNIEATRLDTHATDLKDGINACLKKDRGNTATADIPMGGFTLTNIAAAGARTEPARFADVQDNLGQYVATVGGTADAITLTPSIAITAYAARQRFSFIASGDNTGAATVNVSGVGAKDIKRPDGSNSALSASDIISGTIVDIEYDGTRFLLLNWQNNALSILDINGGTAETDPAVADLVAIYDASASANRKMTLANLLKVITALTAEASPAVDDELALHDTSGSSTAKITLANLLKVVNALTEDGLAAQKRPRHAVLVVFQLAALDLLGPGLREPPGAVGRMEDHDSGAGLERDPVLAGAAPFGCILGGDDDADIADGLDCRRDVASHDAVHVHQHQRLAGVEVHCLKHDNRLAARVPALPRRLREQVEGCAVLGEVGRELLG